MNHGLHCLQLSNIKLVKSGNWNNQISYKRTATNDLPLKEIDAIVLFLLFLYILYTMAYCFIGTSKIHISKETNVYIQFNVATQKSNT